MTLEKGRATVAAVAPRHKLQNRLYTIRVAESSANLQNEIGELLFCLEFPLGRELSRAGWRLFERLVGRYVDSKDVGRRL